MNKPTSNVWSYFTKLDNTYAKCNICYNKYSYKTTLTNLKKHLSGPHDTVLKQEHHLYDINLENELFNGLRVQPEILAAQSNSIASPSTSTFNPTMPIFSKPMNPNPSSTKELNIQKRKQISVIKYLPKNVSQHVKKKIDKSLLNLFIRDLQPFEIVNDVGFKEFVKHLNSNYTLPNRRTISKELIPALYEQCLAEMKTLVSTIENACLTTNCWTSRNNENFIVIMIHFIDDEFTLKSILLECSHFKVSNTEINLSQEIKCIVKSWNLLDKITFAVSDYSFNVKNALNLLQLKNMQCFAKTLNNIVQSALNMENDLILKVENIVTHFKKITITNNKFETYQINNGIIKSKKLLRNVQTRWHSTFYMINRIVELEDTVRGTLEIHIDASDNLQSDEWTILKELCKALKPFEEATTAISKDKFMTASLVIVIVDGLFQVCTNLSKTNFNPRVLNVIHKLLCNMNEIDGFKYLLKNTMLCRCTFLDPRFKTIPFKNNLNVLMATKNDIIEKIAHIVYLRNAEKDTSSNRCILTDESNVHSKRDEFSIWDSIDTDVAKTTSLETLKSRSIVEVQRYLEDPLLNRDCDPLKWWKDHSYNYPHLSILAKNTLCCVGTSVPCDAIFTKAGLVLKDRKCRLKAENVNMLLFLNSNSINR